jgi:hypothetical protein
MDLRNIYKPDASIDIMEAGQVVKFSEIRPTHTYLNLW